MSISELSPGDKLSLKGKLFELQRKLSLVELEQAQEPDCSFRPAITDFELPDRHPDYSENVRRAEEARKERLRALQANLQREYDESHTFSPRLVAKHVSASKVPHSGKSGASRGRTIQAGGGDGGKADKPVHQRLYEMGAEYRRKQDERNERAKHFDCDGRRLFAPTLPTYELRGDVSDDGGGKRRGEHAQHRSEHGHMDGQLPPPPPPPEHDHENRMMRSRLSGATPSKGFKQKEENGNMDVQDFLYRDALDRNERLAMLRESMDEEAARLANQSKLNKKSEALLRQRYERQVREGLDTILRVVSFSSEAAAVGRPDPASDMSMDAVVELGHLQSAVIAICSRDLWMHEDGKSVAGGSNDPYKLSALIWEALGRREGENIDSKAFIDKNLTAMMNKKKGKVDILCHFIDRLQLLVQELRNDAEEQEEEERRRSDAKKDKPKFKHLKNAPKPSLSREERTALLRKQLADREKSECTFKPTLYTKSSFAALNATSYSPCGEWADEVDYSYGSLGDAGALGKPRFERLYALKDKLPESIVQQKHKSFQEREMEGCTFAPRVPQHRTPARTSASSLSEEDRSVGSSANRDDALASHNSPGRAPSALPKGFLDSVERARIAREMRLRKEQGLTDTTAFSEERYQRSRKLAAEGPKPFHFHSEERLKQRRGDEAAGARSPERTEVGETARLYIDVNLGDGMKGRVPKIAISDWDDPASLSRDFCRIYGLDHDAEKILTQVIFQNMRHNGVHVFGDQEVEVEVASDSDGQSS